MPEPNKAIGERRFGQAEKLLETVLLSAPMCAQANLALASLLTNSNRAHFAGVHFDRAKKIGGEAPFVAVMEANNLRAQTRMSAAVARFREAVALDPANDAALGGLIAALELAGEVDEARELVDELPADRSSRPEIRRACAVVCASLGDEARALSFLPLGELRPLELFERGRILDRLERFDEAWADWMEAKRILREKAGHIYQREAVVRAVDELTDLTYAAHWRLVRHESGESWEPPAPLFVTGFPRSGTTLVETVLSSHSAIEAGDELPFLNECIALLPRVLALRVPYPKSLEATTLGNHGSVFAMLRAHYMSRAREKIELDGAKAGARFFTDKMPLNEIHLPLMSLLFPQSPIVYVRRHPLDIILSSMSYFITHGFYYASELAGAAHCYAAFDSLLQTYRRRFGPRAFIEFRYEAFVNEPATMGAALMADIGLEIEPAQNEFHLNGRHSRTISHNQVRRPLYRSSVDRFRNYLDKLAPIVDELRPIIEREGYSV